MLYVKPLFFRHTIDIQVAGGYTSETRNKNFTSLKEMKNSEQKEIYCHLYNFKPCGYVTLQSFFFCCCGWFVLVLCLYNILGMCDTSLAEWNKNEILSFIFYFFLYFFLLARKIRKRVLWFFFNVTDKVTKV